MINLASVRLFAGLPKDEVSVIMAATFRRRFHASETIVTADKSATQLIVVKTGFVNFYIVTEDGRKILLRRLVPGNAFGIAAFLSEPMGYLGTATAVREVEVFTWDHRTVRQLARNYPRFPENAFRIALRYIAEFTRRHISLVANTAQERLAYALTNLGSRAGHLLPSGVEIDIRNEDLAALADVSFFTVSRFIKKWERMGALDKRRGKVLIRCPEKLLNAPDSPAAEDLSVRQMA